MKICQKRTFVRILFQKGFSLLDYAVVQTIYFSFWWWIFFQTLLFKWLVLGFKTFFNLQSDAFCYFHS